MDAMTTPIDELAGIDLRGALKEAVRVLSGGRRGYVGDHWIREVQVNEATVLRLKATLDAARSTPVPASNVSEGLTRQRALNALDSLDIIDGIVDDTHPEGDGCPLCHELDNLREVLSALAHAAPEGLDRERQVAFLRRYEGSDGVGEPTILFPGTAEDLLERLSQPDATDEAGR